MTGSPLLPVPPTPVASRSRLVGCLCQSSRPRLFADAAVSRAVDPTGTTDIRRRLEREFVRRVNAARRQVREAVLADVLGLRRGGDVAKIVQSEMFARLFRDAAPSFANETPASRVESFSRWLTGMLQEEILGVVPSSGQRVTWTSPYVVAAYRKGIADASARLPGFTGGGERSPAHAERVGLLLAKVAADTGVIVTALVDQTTRLVTEALTTGGASGLARRVGAVFAKTGVTRAKVLARVAVVAAHADAVLSTYEEAGVQRVLPVIERQERTRVGDAALSVRLGTARNPVNREHPEGQRFRSSGLRSGGGAGGRVALETAGDDDVCPECERLEGRVYTVRAARGVIPVHPRCRCSWVPA